MKKTLFIAFLLSIAFAACKKEEPVIAEDNNYYNDISDRTIETGRMAIIFVRTLDSQTELSVDNLPDSVTSTVSKFDDSLVMLIISASVNAKPGVYPIKLTVKTTSGSKPYNINLTIKDSRDKYTGKYTAVYNSDPGSPKLADNTIEIQADPGDGTKIIINDLLYEGTSFTASFINGFDYYNFENKKITNGIFSGYELSWESLVNFTPPPSLTIILKKDGKNTESNVSFTRKE